MTKISSLRTALLLLFLLVGGSVSTTLALREASTRDGTKQVDEHVLAVGESKAVHAETAANPRFSNFRRRLLCLGIFRDCDEEDEENGDEAAEATNTTDVESEEDEDEDDNDGGLLGDVELCLGIFRDCNNTNEESDTNETATSSESSPSGSDNANTTTPTTEGGGDTDTNENNDENDESDSSASPNCRDESDGIFGGRPLLGECGIVTEFLEDVFGDFWRDSDTDGDGDIDELPEFEFDNDGSSDKGPFGLGLLPEGGLLWRVFNRNDDLNIIEVIMEAFNRNTQSLASDFLQEWSESAVTTNATCVNEVTAPACLDVLGREGFWVCRTLTDPYTGVPSSKSVCIGEGAFLENNDNCGCCAAEGNSTATSTCPASCSCPCDLLGDTDTGVWITADIGDDASPINQCVDSRWAVSITSRFDSISCLAECPSEEE